MDGAGLAPAGVVPSREPATGPSAAVPPGTAGWSDMPSLATPVRRRVVAAQLEAHLPTPPCPVADLGCGPGWLAVRLARHGYAVTAVDRSAAMLDEGRRWWDAEPRASDGRLTFVRGRVESGVDLLDARRFALVCCHGVAPFVADVDALGAVMSDGARPGGVVSFVFKTRPPCPCGRR